MNSHASTHSSFDTKKFYEKLLLLDQDENLLDEDVEDRLAGRVVGAGFNTFDDMITQVSLVSVCSCLCVNATGPTSYLLSTDRVFVYCLHICAQARRKEVKKRRLGSMRMHLSSGLGGRNNQIALSIYKTVSVRRMGREGALFTLAPAFVMCINVSAAILSLLCLLHLSIVRYIVKYISFFSSVLFCSPTKLYYVPPRCSQLHAPPPSGCKPPPACPPRPPQASSVHLSSPHTCTWLNL